MKGRFLDSEKIGTSDQLLETVDFVVRIPMHGECDSIDAAVASGVLLFEMASQRVIQSLRERDWSTIVQYAHL